MKTSGMALVYRWLTPKQDIEEISFYSGKAKNLCGMSYKIYAMFIAGLGLMAAISQRRNTA